MSPHWGKTGFVCEYFGTIEFHRKVPYLVILDNNEDFV